jgi:hypothetical protein
MKQTLLFITTVTSLSITPNFIFGQSIQYGITVGLNKLHSSDLNSKAEFKNGLIYGIYSSIKPSNHFILRVGLDMVNFGNPQNNTFRFNTADKNIYGNPAFIPNISIFHSERIYTGYIYGGISYGRFISSFSSSLNTFTTITYKTTKTIRGDVGSVHLGYVIPIYKKINFGFELSFKKSFNDVKIEYFNLPNFSNSASAFPTSYSEILTFSTLSFTVCRSVNYGNKRKTSKI